MFVYFILHPYFNTKKGHNTSEIEVPICIKVGMCMESRRGVMNIVGSMKKDKNRGPAFDPLAGII